MSTWPERKLNSLQDIAQLSEKIGALWPNSQRSLFRGQSSAKWTLEPSLARELKGSRLNAHEVSRLERDSVNRFRQEAHRELAPSVLPSNDFFLNWWPLMRHYGTPTRLLDWSQSPYVALYFAVKGRWDEDGAIWWFHAATADNLMGRNFGALYDEQEKALFSGNDDPFLLTASQPMLFVFELKRAIERIGNQQGFFSVCLDPRADHADVLTDLTAYADGPHCEKLIVPKVLKPELLRHLYLMNVTGKSMFPGLDGIGLTLSELTKLSIRFGVP